MRLVALKKVKYGGVMRVPGDEFETTSDKHAEMLMGFGKARKKEEEAEVSKKNRYKRRDMVPEPF